MIWIEEIVSRISDFIWGIPMQALTLGVGLFLSMRLGWVQIRCFPSVLKKTIGLFSQKTSSETNQGISRLQSVATALAGTIGTGSIAGVATAVALGGAGAVFWMWVASFFGMATKYCEICLSVRYRKKGKDGKNYGGPMFYILVGVKSKRLARLFSIFALFASFGIGNLTQANTISSILDQTMGVRPVCTALLLMLLVGMITFGGLVRIARINERIVPVMSIFYVSVCFLSIAKNYRCLPLVFESIFAQAFSLKSASSGFIGSCMMRGMRNGFSKGIFSSEAGLGSAPIAHGASVTKNAHEQGLWGIFEVFLTTFVICSVTAFVVLTSNAYGTTDALGANLVIVSLRENLPNFGTLFVSLSSILFAFSSILSWQYYGEVCIGFLSTKRFPWILIYRSFYLIAVLMGSVVSFGLVWNLSEILNALMSIPNLIALLLLSGQVARESKNQTMDLVQNSCKHQNAFV